MSDSKMTGPQVYGIAFCPVPYLDDLKALGFAGTILKMLLSSSINFSYHINSIAAP